ncbi:protein Brevis radix [Salix suchowensis]|nr:protein Brevis radix [Salix suchowensis]
MLTCIACSKRLNNGSLTPRDREEDADVADLETLRTKQALKALTAQIKDMAVKASGAYRNCKPCSGSSSNNNNRNYAESDAASDSARFHCLYRRAGSSNSTPRNWGKGSEARLKGLSSGEGTPASVSGRTESVVFMEEDEPKEWVAQVEPGVLITFVSLPDGGNDLKRIRFSREMFNKWQAQRWWAENYDKVMELYNVRQFNHQSVPLPTSPRSEDESSKPGSAKDSPMTPALGKERPRNFHHPSGMGYSPSDSLDHQPMQSHQNFESAGLASTPKLSNIAGAKTETSSIDGSVRTSMSRESDRSEELSISNASDMETEWVEQDEPGVYITIRALPGGTRELRRVRFSRETFGETRARLWWEENRARIHEQYLYR